MRPIALADWRNFLREGGQFLKRPLVIIKAGSARAAVRRQFGDFEDWLCRGLGLSAREIRLVRAAEGEPLPDPEACGGVVVTGSYAMVTEGLPWSLAVSEWLPGVMAGSIPLLGICYGHQLLAAAMGGRVEDHPDGPEMGTVPVELLPAARHDPLFAPLPESFPVQASHRQSVLSLPPGAVLLARNDFEPHHAFRLGECAWGVQFHPECSREIMAAELAADAEEPGRDGLGRATRHQTLTATPDAAALLPRFAELVRAFSR